MRKTLNDYKTRKIANLEKIRGGGQPGGPIDKDKIRKPKRG